MDTRWPSPPPDVREPTSPRRCSASNLTCPNTATAVGQTQPVLAPRRSDQRKVLQRSRTASLAPERVAERDVLLLIARSGTDSTRAGKALNPEVNRPASFRTAWP